MHIHSTALDVVHHISFGSVCFLFFFVIDDLLFLYSPESEENVFFFSCFGRDFEVSSPLVPLPEPTHTQGPAPPGFTRRHVVRGEWSIA